MFRNTLVRAGGLRRAMAPGGRVHGSRLFCASVPNAEHKEDKKPDDKSAKTLWQDKPLVRQLSILTGSQLILNLGYAQLVPVMPLFAAEWGGHLGITGVGLVLAAPSVAKFVTNVPFGRMCDTVGRVPLMYAGTFLTSVGTILTGFTGSLWSMFPCRMLVGVGSSASMSGSGAYMQDLSDRAPEHRAKIMGLQGMVVGSVWVVGPALGGYLAESYGLQNSFIIAGAGAALCSLGYTFLPETLKKLPEVQSEELQKKRSFREEFKKWREDTTPILESQNQQALIALACSWPLRFSCFATVVAIHASETISAGPQQIGVMYTVLALSHGLTMPLGSYLADKTDTDGPKKGLVVPAGFASAGAFASMAFASSIEHYYMAMAVQGISAGFLQPAVGAFTAHITPTDKRGQAMSFQRQAGDGIALVGPVGLGLLADVTTCPLAILFTSGLMGGCNLAYLLKAHKKAEHP
eukprot:TRINITY_DN19436_c0_g2_i1.p1 TRINITY_DN19436_c0_g2~~TRINITY_DN19436_c0_g2_i1.p1  ORF type:complete len:464 (-),score=91.84 TRINITY_DN19436_c0_g2_i1:312-1703(-)